MFVWKNYQGHYKQKQILHNLDTISEHDQPLTPNSHYIPSETLISY